jgi:predicted phage terminase large subunit-like protein
MNQLALSPALARALLNEMHRRSLYSCYQLVFEIINGYPPKPAPYLDAIAHQLERVFRGETRRLINTMPPRHGKSEMTSVAFVAWVLGHAPSTKFMLCSYGLDLSRTNLAKVRQVLEDPRYQAIFPNVHIDPRERRRNAFATTAGGAVMAVSTGGSVTGFGTHIMIIDDLHKADEALTPVGREAAFQFYQNTLVSRFNDPTQGRTIVVGQRLHEDDIVGHLLENAADWHHINLPAIAHRDEIFPLSRGQSWLRRRGDVLHPEHMPLAELEERRRESGPVIFSAQYLQDPVAQEGNLLREEHFRRFEVKIQRSDFDKVFQSWDTASSTLPTADWSVCTTWGYLAGRLFLLDILRARLDYWDLKRAVLAMRQKWRPDDVIIEAIGIGKGLCQELNRTSGSRYWAWEPAVSKEERLLAQTGQIEEGRVWLPAELPGLDTFLSEMKAFPLGRYDDQVDTLTQVLEFIMWRWQYAETKYDSRRRPLNKVRTRVRPPLPPLPEWIY